MRRLVHEFTCPFHLTSSLILTQNQTQTGLNSEAKTEFIAIIVIYLVRCLRQVIIVETSHASIAYHKQIPPQRTGGTIGSVWQESTPSKETTGPAKRYENEQSEMRNGERP